MYRDHTKVVKIGDRVIGGGNPILIQSMTNTRTEDVKATVEQIHRLTEAGCEIIRCTVPTKEAAEAIKEIKKQITIPLVADGAHILWIVGYRISAYYKVSSTTKTIFEIQYYGGREDNE